METQNQVTNRDVLVAIQELRLLITANMNVLQKGSNSIGTLLKIVADYDRTNYNVQLDNGFFVIELSSRSMPIMYYNAKYERNEFICDNIAMIEQELIEHLNNYEY